VCVQANQILGLAPGEVFVHRCVGNLATHKDMNAMTCLEYAVDALKVRVWVMCGNRGQAVDAVTMQIWLMCGNAGSCPAIGHP
jgi:carbonic anhydrase